MKSDFYQAFEDRFRGSTQLIKNRLRVYVPFITPLEKFYPNFTALDLGCGRGEWMSLLREHSLSCTGVDIDLEMISVCKAMGFQVMNSDAIEALKSLPENSLVIISAFHVVEHISFDDLRILVQEALRVLRPGGLLILETPNPENILVGSSTFYLDPTHKRPIPSQLLAFLTEYVGFERNKILRLHEATKSPDLKLSNIINDVSPDYAVVAQKKGAQELDDGMRYLFDFEYGQSLQGLLAKYDEQAFELKERIICLMNRMEELIEVSNKSVKNRLIQKKKSTLLLFKLKSKCLLIVCSYYIFDKLRKYPILKRIIKNFFLTNLLASIFSKLFPNISALIKSSVNTKNAALYISNFEDLGSTKLIKLMGSKLDEPTLETVTFI